jgi:hypothetical protein
VCPAATRFADIGNPISPSPIQPIGGSKESAFVRGMVSTISAIPAPENRKYLTF